MKTVKVSETWLSFRVADTGRGIPDRQREQLFAEFSRGPWRCSDQPVSGWGIGLDYVCKATERLPQHGLKFRSRQGRGTDFEILVPILPGFQWDSMASTGSTEELRGRHIVIVDGLDDGYAKLAEDGRGWQCVIERVESVDQASRLFRDLLVTPDLVIADVFQSGFGDHQDFIDLLQAEFGDIPILIHTAITLTQQQRDSLPRHAFLSRKPVRQGILVVAMVRAIRQGREAES